MHAHQLGVAAAFDGRLEIEHFPDALGGSCVVLDSARYALCGDFDVSFDYEIVEASDTSECVDFVFEIPGVAHLSWECVRRHRVAARVA